MSLQLSGTSGVLDNSGAFIAGTAVASTSGTSISYTSIPSWVKRISVMYSGVSTSGSSHWQIQIGSGSYVTSGYAGIYLYNNGASGAAANPTTGFVSFHDTPSNLRSGIHTLSLLDSSTNTWAMNGFLGNTESGYIFYTAGSIALSGSLTQLRVTTVNGTDTFTAGKINILYE
jgi:hypothetical protein